jgi:hypothetical protein
MFIEMLDTVGAPALCYERGESYEVSDAHGASWIRSGVAKRTTQPPRIIADLLARLDIAAGRRALFLPFVGEFGHLILTHIRLVHFSRAAHKIVCCRPGEQVLYPSAAEFVTDWTDPVPDDQRIATNRSQAFDWHELEQRFPDAVAVTAGNLSPSQELHCINAGQPIPFRPRRRGLRADIILGVRHRKLFAERNWPHWQLVADAIHQVGLTFATMGHRDTSFDLQHQQYHTGDLDTDAAIESLQNCRLYIGTDSGGSHLAATAGAPMLVFRTDAGGSRDMFQQMEDRNPGRVTVLPMSAWNRPAEVIAAGLSRVDASR